MTARKIRQLDLALQGGGSHGAFTWGVLDALLEAGCVAFDGISGTSAGAMNAVVLAAGFAAAETDGLSDAAAHRVRCACAREKLHTFWYEVGQVGTLLAASPASFAAQMMPWLKPMLSPQQSNPFDINPLRTILNRVVDFEGIAALQDALWMPKLFVCATNVRTGQGRVFGNHELSAAVIMASACLPMLYQTVEIDGEAYWDGGYAGNPALFPLISRTDSTDILLVQINPMHIDTVPTDLSDIQDRVNQITFNAGLLQELRAIRFVAKLVDEKRLDIRHYRKIRMHHIDGGSRLQEFDGDSTVKSDWAFLQQLFAIGREFGEVWLKNDFPSVGIRSTMSQDW